MHLYVQCTKCNRKLYIFENIAYTMGCQSCGCFDGVIHVQNAPDGEKLYLQCCGNQGICQHVQEIKAGEELSFTHQCDKGKTSKIFKIIRPEIDYDRQDEEAKKEVNNNAQVDTIVLCHNRLDLTQECLSKIRKQTIPCRIILVDNTSTDGTSEWAKKQKDIVYIRNQINLGCAIGRNQGAKYATNRYIWFLDNDQYPSRNSLQKLIMHNTDIVGVEKWEVFSNDAFVLPAKNTSQEYRCYVGSGGMLIKRQIFEALKGYDERFAPAWYEDADLCFRARVAGYTIRHEKDSGVEHIGNQTTMAQATFDQKKAKAESQRLFAVIWGDYLRNYKSREMMKRLQDIKEGKSMPPLGKLNKASYTLPPQEIKNTQGEKVSPLNNAIASPLPSARKRSGRPKVLLIADVSGWAWDYKAQQIKKYLSDEFDIDIRYWHENRDRPQLDKYDILFTFECNFIFHLQPYNVNLGKCISGVTAHSYVQFQNYANALKSVGYIHANSKLLFDEIKKFNKNCFYVPNGIDIEQFKFVKRNIRQEFTAGYVGKDTPKKGLQEFIIPACKKAGVKLKIQSCKYNSHNKIDHKDMPKFYEDIDVILIASIMDGTPNQLLEAAATGRTFIGNKIGNIPEFVGEGKNGFMIERKVADYAEKLLYLKQNRKLCRDMGLSARQTVEAGWSWKVQAENYRKLFQEALKGAS